jgi:alkylation response protein AidB-like acyl-CoA dehydrogenase
MNFTFSKRQQELKASFDAYFEAAMHEAPAVCRDNPMATYSNDEAFAFHKEMQQRLGEKGWLSLPWPKEYGGSDASIIDQVLFNESREKFNCPGYDHMGLGMFAPTLLVSANDEQKKRLLPPIARGEVQYCQGWSEPDAGSDLANLSTTAIRDGNEYVVNGQKTWTSAAHRSDCMFLLARTDPDSKRSRGLSMFHLRMDLPGIEVRPILLMSGEHSFNDVYLTDVRIPAIDLIGEEGRGWEVTQNTMNFERSGLGMFTAGMRMLDQIIDYTRRTRRGGKLLCKNPIIRQKVAALYARLEAGSSLALRIACMQEESGLSMTAAATASESKVMGTELSKQVYTLATEVMGLYGKVNESRWSPMGAITEAYQHAPGPTIAGGSNEIQRSIIAWLGLGMPRYRLTK